jgi:hypothetical protein
VPTSALDDAIRGDKSHFFIILPSEFISSDILSIKASLLLGVITMFLVLRDTGACIPGADAALSKKRRDGHVDLRV